MRHYRFENKMNNVKLSTLFHFKQNGRIEKKSEFKTEYFAYAHTIHNLRNVTLERPA